MTNQPSERAPEGERTSRILVVDDEQSLLDGIRRVHRRTYDIVTACGARAGIEAVRSEGPFAVIICDYQMPEMNGAEFLERVLELSPHSVRMMLSGNADLGAAIDAVNQAHVFRFLTKPCPPQAFRTAVDAALEQFGLLRAEQLLLEETVRGSIEVLVDVLTLSSPEAFGRSSRVRQYVSQLVAALRLPDPWRFETAALLSQIGYVAVPPDVLLRRFSGEPLSARAEEMLASHASVARDLVCKIPRLEEVAEIIAHQDLRFDQMGSSGLPRPVAVGAHVLAAALAFDDLVTRGHSPESAVRSMGRDKGRYEPRVLAMLCSAKLPGQDLVVRTMDVHALHVGMIIDQDVFASNGTLIVARGNVISGSMLERLRNSAAEQTIPGTVRVRARLSLVEGVA